MKNFFSKFLRSISLLPVLALLAVVAPAANAVSTPSLGAASTFGILANAYTNNGPTYTVINGDVGYTTTAGSPPAITGTNYGSGGPYATAGSDQASALSSLNLWGCGTTFPAGPVDLATTNVGSGTGIFPPGVYCTAGSNSLTIGSAGITLSGSGTYIFRIGGALTTKSFSWIHLTGGASADDVFWTPVGATSLAVDDVGYSYFMGTIIDDAGIWMGKNVNMIGRPLAFGGTITTSEDDSITPSIATIRVIKTVINDNGGIAVPASFNLHVKHLGIDVAGSPHVGVSPFGTYYSLAPSTYVVSEDVNVGYTSSFSGDCDSSGNVTLLSGNDYTCTITNNDVAVSPTGTLHVIKVFYNDYGGTAVPANANVHVKNGAGNVAGSPQPGAVSPGTSYTLNPDIYTVSEDPYPGYTAIFSGDCNVSGVVTLGSGDNKTCTISNDQNPPSPSLATLHVIKVFYNDYGGTKVPSDANVHVKNGAGDVAGSPQPGAVSPGTPYTLSADTYIVSEDPVSGYSVNFTGDCDTNGHVTLGSGDNKTCTVNNDQNPPTSTLATFHLIKHVVNDNGGTATAADFKLHVMSTGPFGSADVAGSPAAGAEAPGTTYSLSAGSYWISEDAFPGYTATISGDCTLDGIATLAASDNKTCTITNNDISPSLPKATLHVIKVVINDNGGKAVASSAIVHVGSGLGEVAGSPQPGAAAPGTSYTVAVGTYTVSENAFSGYTATFSGDCNASGNVTLAANDNKTCTITNNDTPSYTPPPPPPPPPSEGKATLHVVKVVINDNGGKAVVVDAVIHVTSGSGDVAGSPKPGAGSPGTAYVLMSGTYNVSENFFAGYTVTVTGDCAKNGDITLLSGDDKTCTITNNDIPGVITPPPPPPPPPPTTGVVCDICARLTYDVYIINPDLTERHTGTTWVRVTDRGNKIKRYSFEDATIDPRNPLYDYNDSVIDVDFTDCRSVKFMFISSDASWKHQVRIKVSIDGVTQSDTLVTDDSKRVVGTIKTINASTGLNTKLACAPGVAAKLGLLGRILLQVQQHGEAWYILPGTGLRWYMKDGPAAYNIMRKLGKGIADKDLASIPIVATVDEMKASKSACGSSTLGNRFKGWIMLQVQQHGEAWYIDPGKCRRIYLKDGVAAYTLMRFLGLGIADVDLNKIGIGQ